MHLIQIAHLIGSVATQGDIDVIRVVMPIVGITVVMLGLIALAFVLKMFVFLDNESPKVKKTAPTTSNKVVTQEVNESLATSSDDDELAAIAFALYLYTSEENVQMPLTHNPEYNNAGWQASQRQSQIQTYNRWSALRRK
ncbi:OadG family protein [bacterium]|nr:OadG family protein [bacterium]